MIFDFPARFTKRVERRYLRRSHKAKLVSVTLLEVLHTTFLFRWWFQIHFDLRRNGIRNTESESIPKEMNRDSQKKAPHNRPYTFTLGLIVNFKLRISCHNVRNKETLTRKSTYFYCYYYIRVILESASYRTSSVVHP